MCPRSFKGLYSYINFPYFVHHVSSSREDPQPQEAAQMKAGGAAANEVELPLRCSPKSIGYSVTLW